jgi:hypothetical protein
MAELHYIELILAEKPEGAEQDLQVDGNYVKTIFETISDNINHSKSVFDGNYLVLETKFVGSYDWTEDELCMVCKLPITRSHDASVVQCPFCGLKAHKKHLFEWMKIRKMCPYCRREISERSILHVKP